jgi:hypothetical protein
VLAWGPPFESGCRPGHFSRPPLLGGPTWTKLTNLPLRKKTTDAKWAPLSHHSAKMHPCLAFGGLICLILCAKFPRRRHFLCKSNDVGWALKSIPTLVLIALRPRSGESNQHSGSGLRLPATSGAHPVLARNPRSDPNKPSARHHFTALSAVLIPLLHRGCLFIFPCHI